MQVAPTGKNAFRRAGEAITAGWGDVAGGAGDLLGDVWGGITGLFDGNGEPSEPAAYVPRDPVLRARVETLADVSPRELVGSEVQPGSFGSLKPAAAGLVAARRFFMEHIEAG